MKGFSCYFLTACLVFTACSGPEEPLFIDGRETYLLPKTKARPVNTNEMKLYFPIQEKQLNIVVAEVSRIPDLELKIYSIDLDNQFVRVSLPENLLLFDTNTWKIEGIGRVRIESDQPTSWKMPKIGE